MCVYTKVILELRDIHIDNKNLHCMVIHSISLLLQNRKL